MLTLDSLLEEMQELLGKYDELFTEETGRSYVLAFSEKGLNGVYSAHAGSKVELGKVLFSTTNQIAGTLHGVLHTFDPENSMLNLWNQGVDEVNKLVKAEGIDAEFSRFAVEEEEEEDTDREGFLIRVTNKNHPHYGRIFRIVVDCGDHVHVETSDDEEISLDAHEYEVLDN